MKGMLNPNSLESMPAVRDWLRNADATRHIVQEKYASDCGEEECLNVAVQENVLVQIDNLRTDPAVAARLSIGKLRIYGWVYTFTTGEVFAYDHGEGQFRPLAEARGSAIGGRLL